MPDRLKSIARHLRTNATNAGRRSTGGVRREQIAGFKFRRQVAVDGFVVDFACYAARLVIEVDGATHSTAAERAGDASRSAPHCAGRVMKSCDLPMTRFSTTLRACLRPFG